jgi:hypothetical protein
MTKNKKTKKHLLIGRLRAYLTLQLQAYNHKDWPLYDKLEIRIQAIEKRL